MRLLPLLTLALLACNDAGLTGKVNETCFPDLDGDGFGDDLAESIVCSGDESTWVQERGDCDDGDPLVHSDAAETCDEADNNCNGSVDEGVTGLYYSDADGDGHGDPDAPVQACYEAAGLVATALDCDDAASAVNPDAEEVCNELDDDCDGATDEDVTSEFFTDNDGDGFGDDSAPITACTLPAGASEVGGDCDDDDATSNPSETEICDEADNDCDGDVDEDAFNAGWWYPDADLDGFGDAASGARSCTAPEGWIADDTDCADDDATAWPGATEVCDGVDDDCDGSVDEDAVDVTAWYSDNDGDGYGDATTEVYACDAPTGAVTDATDCNDTNAYASPVGVEVCDGVDNDCDGGVDVGALDLATWFADSDGDGFGDAAISATACEAPEGYVADDEDCDDAEAAAYPGNTEACDSIDNDCDGVVDDGATDSLLWYEDRDSDGFGDPARSAMGCAPPDGFVDDATDCDDLDALSYPAADELCDDADNDCDGTIDEDPIDAGTSYADVDADGYGDPAAATTACDIPTGNVGNDDDCDDSNAAARPGATEVCDGVDNDCDGSADELGAVGGSEWYLDADGDGFGDASLSTTACDAPTSYVTLDTDCDDDDATVNPGETEYCDGVDNDCDGGEDGVVTFTISSTSAKTDLSATWGAGTASSAASVTLTSSGTTAVCPGTYYVSITASASKNTITGVYGAAETTLSGAGGKRTLSASNDLTLSGLTLADGYTTGNGGNVTVTGGADADITDVVLTGGESVRGANLAFTGGGTLTMEGVELLDGDASSYGGGLWITGSTADLTDVLADGNQADIGGGLYIYNTTLTGDSVNVTNNSAATNGGGMALYSAADVTLSTSDVSDNSGGDSGGGAYLNGSDLTINSSSNIHENDASIVGGGLMLDGDSDFTCTGSSSTTAGVWGNTSILAGGVYMTGATGSVLTSTRCDWTSTEDNDWYDIITLFYYYTYGDNASFTCSGFTCS